MSPLVRKLVIGLAISVALNLFVLGFLAARGLRRQQGPFGMHPQAGEAFGPRHMMRGARDLGPHAAELMDARRDAMRAHHRALDEAQQAVNTALIAEPYDRAALVAALAAMRTRQAAAAEAAHNALVELASKLDAPGRRALAERGRRMPGP